MKVAINLLPIEYIEKEAKRANFYKIQALGVGIILIMVFLSSLSVALRILQSQKLKSIQTEVSASEQKITNLKDKQVSLLVLKNRMSAINQYLGMPSKQSNAYELINKLIPSSVSISSISLDTTGKATILALVPDSGTLDTMVNNLTDKESNANVISKISLDTISRARDGVYRISMSIYIK